jgi:hypothetical protein
VLVGSKRREEKRKSQPQVTRLRGFYPFGFEKKKKKKKSLLLQRSCEPGLRFAGCGLTEEYVSKLLLLPAARNGPLGLV